MAVSSGVEFYKYELARALIRSKSKPAKKATAQKNRSVDTSFQRERITQKRIADNQAEWVRFVRSGGRQKYEWAWGEHISCPPLDLEQSVFLERLGIAECKTVVFGPDEDKTRTSLDRRAHWKNYWIERGKRHREWLAKRAAYHADKRRVQLIYARPEWVDRRQLRAVYQRARALNKAHGCIKVHVDHIIPLTHPRVCGLHVPWNLRIIGATENLSKSNRLDDKL